MGASWGLWRASAGYSYTTNQGYAHTEARDFSLQLEVMRVVINRPWLDPLAFRTRNYKFSNYLISDGARIDEGQNPSATVVMPIYPTAALVARRVKITANFSSSDSSYFDKIVDGSTSVGWGPFSFSGRYHQEEHSRFATGQAASNTIEQPGAQVVGFFCDVLPRCPDPDPSLVYPTRLSISDYFPDLMKK